MDRDRYYVIPAKYIKLVSREQKKQFQEILGVITNIREALGKEIDPGYYVCKHDEPYAESVRDMIEEGEDAKENIGIDYSQDLGFNRDFFVEDTLTMLSNFVEEELIDESDSSYTAIQSNFDESKFDENVFSEEDKANKSAKAKREEIQRHVEHMAKLNLIGKKNVK